MTEYPSPYWTGTSHGIRYMDAEGNTIRDDPNEDGRQLLIDSVKKTLGLTQRQAERLADHPEDYA